MGQPILLIVSQPRLHRGRRKALRYNHCELWLLEHFQNPPPTMPRPSKPHQFAAGKIAPPPQTSSSHLPQRLSRSGAAHSEKWDTLAHSRLGSLSLGKPRNRQVPRKCTGSVIASFASVFSGRKSDAVNRRIRLRLTPGRIYFHLHLLPLSCSQLTSQFSRERLPTGSFFNRRAHKEIASKIAAPLSPCPDDRSPHASLQHQW